MNKMEHLACFVGGLFGLSADTLDWRSDEAMKAGEGVTETCHRTYNSSTTNVGPESFSTSGTGLTPMDRRSLMRPETIESYFVLWRLTHNQKYRDWGWEAAQGMEKHFRTGAGFSGIRDVNSRTPVKDDVMQSFFLAETLKYLYLLFSDDTLIPLDKYVLNTEAHPVPILPKGSLPKLVKKEYQPPAPDPVVPDEPVDHNPVEYPESMVPEPEPVAVPEPAVFINPHGIDPANEIKQPRPVVWARDSDLQSDTRNDGVPDNYDNLDMPPVRLKEGT